MSVFELPTVTLIPNGIHHPPIEDGRLLPNSVKMPPEDTRGGQAEYQYQPQEELERLKSENKSLQEQLNEQTTLEQHGVPRKWWQWWK
ncbi:hypothetical protein [Enterococcus durans]|uniref:hypothetical protein n=1 Tax=Enterococcus durans TaxID=53345 RepID=UPI0015F069FE|nr:hypothetical protein [Enterococcus durans]